ncbi:hypothetical protein HDV00_002860 [Rhizophlyctis rosea]|nr:hypothetical protein HDV00_002860 [Rhizophlyctis rosea]
MASGPLTTLPDLVLRTLFDQLDATTLNALRLVSRNHNNVVNAFSAFNLISQVKSTLFALPLPPEVDRTERSDDALTEDECAYQRKLQSLVFVLSDLKTRNPVSSAPDLFGSARWRVEQSPPSAAFDYESVTVLFDRKYLKPRACRYRGVEVTLPDGATVTLIVQERETFWDRSEDGYGYLSVILPATEQWPEAEYLIFTWWYQSGSIVNGFDITDKCDAAQRAADILGIEKSGANFVALVDAACPNSCKWKYAWAREESGENQSEEDDSGVHYAIEWREWYQVAVPDEFEALMNTAKSLLLAVPACTTASVVNGMLREVREHQAVVGLRRLGGFCGMMKATDCTNPPMGVSNYFYDRDAWDPLVIDWFKTHVSVIEAWSEQVPLVYQLEISSYHHIYPGQPTKGLQMKVIFELKPTSLTGKPVRVSFFHEIAPGLNFYGRSTCSLHAIVDNRSLTIIEVGHGYRLSTNPDPVFTPVRGSQAAITTVLQYLGVNCPWRDFMRLLIAGAYASTVRVVAHGSCSYTVEDVLFKGGDHLSVWKRENGFDKDEVRPQPEAGGASDARVSEDADVWIAAAPEVGAWRELNFGGRKRMPKGRSLGVRFGVGASGLSESKGGEIDNTGSDMDLPDGSISGEKEMSWREVQMEYLKRNAALRLEVIEQLQEMEMRRDLADGTDSEWEETEGGWEAAIQRALDLGETIDMQRKVVEEVVAEYDREMEEYERKKEALEKRLRERNEEIARLLQRKKQFQDERTEWEGPIGRIRCCMQEDVRVLFNALWGRD